MSPECAFFVGADGVRCDQLCSQEVARQHLGLGNEDFSKVVEAICQSGTDKQRIKDCPSFTRYSTIWGDLKKWRTRKR